MTTEQGTHHVILTLFANGLTKTLAYTVTLAPGSTRGGVFIETLDRFIAEDPRYIGGATVFFSLEPNTL